MAASPASAGDGSALKGIVELFTSQGCSSCPAADSALKALIEQGDVVALAYHVDYWNYRGWTDTLASKENTDRQYAYSKSMGRNGVYTPQAILNGREHMNGADLTGINASLTRMNGAGEGFNVPVDAEMRGNEIDIKIGSGTGNASVVVVYFDRQQVVNVETGENGGKTIAYWHAVRDIETIGMWDGKAATFTLPASVLDKKKHGGCAVLLQTVTEGDTPGSIIGADTIMPADQS
ncbi:MAG: thioredoxin family protein [Pararhizobium sp.]|nr:thioredoxin family protein [Pararhizobium sp.]MDO9416567.1 thioredoxin family protein [Pararhizobium sp.]